MFKDLPLQSSHLPLPIPPLVILGPQSHFYITEHSRSTTTFLYEVKEILSKRGECIIRVFSRRSMFLFLFYVISAIIVCRSYSIFPFHFTCPSLLSRVMVWVLHWLSFEGYYPFLFSFCLILVGFFCMPTYRRLSAAIFFFSLFIFFLSPSLPCILPKRRPTSRPDLPILSTCNSVYIELPPRNDYC